MQQDYTFYILMNIDLKYQQQGYNRIAGVDEAGRGAWAGPLLAAAVVMSGPRLRGVADSKTLTAIQRKRLFPHILKRAASCAIVSVDQTTIDTLGLHESNKLALSLAVTYLDVKPDIALIDGFVIQHYLPVERVINGDAISYSIAAASIIAKVMRDSLMTKIDQYDARYRFAQHKGYGTAVHQTLLIRHGVSILHRKSFKPVKRVLDSKS